MALEAVAAVDEATEYPFNLMNFEPITIDFRPAIVAIVEDLRRTRSVHEISARFQNTVCAVIGELCCRMRSSEGLNRVCLSGGTFQNLYLLRRTVVELRRRGFEVFLHATVPANDGGIALGQAVVASELLSRGA
jgi:hydrogenase maturation protein HypF